MSSFRRSEPRREDLCTPLVSALQAAGSRSSARTNRVRRMTRAKGSATSATVYFGLRAREQVRRALRADASPPCPCRVSQACLGFLSGPPQQGIAFVETTLQLRRERIQPQGADNVSAAGA